jgi:hypothetical protein
MDRLSSSLSALKEVREAMTELQRKLGSKGRVVAEGRDMGTGFSRTGSSSFFSPPILKSERNEDTGSESCGASR